MTRDELDAIALPPREQLRAALERDPASAGSVFERLDAGYARFVDGFRAWLAAIQAFLFETRGLDALAAANELSPLLEAAERAHAAAADLADSGASDVVRAIKAGNPEAALDAFALREEQHRRTHDLYRDWLSAWLSHVYRAHGIEALESCLRYAGERTLLRWMPHDLARPAEQRVRQWASMLLSNFAEIRVDEDEEKFVITQNICGTCSRQILDGAYGAAPKLAIVEEPHPITFGCGGVPVYRTHVAVMHYLMPIESSGVPWPVVECPDGAATGPCRVLIYKDPAATPQHHAARVRMLRHGAGVAELADAPDSKSGSRKGVWVRVPPPVPLALVRLTSDGGV